MYIIILVYIGVMIITVAGTPRQEKAKSFFTNWVVGLAILILLPHYGFPLLFKLNDAFVAYVGKDASNMDTYYTVLERRNEITGGDSMTEAIRILEEERKQAQEGLELTQISADEIVNDSIEGILKSFFDEGTSGGSLYSFKAYLTFRLKSAYGEYKNYRETMEEIGARTKINETLNRDIIESARSYDDIGDTAQGIAYGLINNGSLSSLLGKYEEAYQYEKQIKQLDQDIVTLQNDILGLMRSYAGEYNRLIFGILFLMLLFQLIGLLVLYFKRLFMIAILITIFPLIMLFYCIDKMADNTAQTLSLWFKEFLSNIFIQSIHAVIYRVLVEMGLEVFKRDNGNWLLLVTAMMLILPAESIMKSLFNLNGFSLGQIGGMLEKATIAIGALKGLATAGKRSSDKSLVAKEKNFTNKMNRKQTRADNKKTARDYNRARNDLRKDGIIKDARTARYDRGDKRYERGNKAREARRKIHNFTAKAGNYTRYARNAAAITAGAIYGIAGGDVNSMAQGAAMAKILSGKQGADKKYLKDQEEAREKARKDAKLKKSLKKAYKRKKP